VKHTATPTVFRATRFVTASCERPEHSLVPVEEIAPHAGHSDRSASIGSSRDAVRAGYSPNTTPTAAENPTASAITFQWIAARSFAEGSGMNLGRRFACELDDDRTLVGLAGRAVDVHRLAP
jgi:hypothetical protein